MTEQEQKDLLATIKNEVVETIEKNSKAFADKSAIEALTEGLEKSMKKEDFASFKSEINEAIVELKAMTEKPATKDEGLMKHIMDNSETFKAIKEGNRTKDVDITIKATEVASDIGDRDVYAQLLPGTYRKPVRRTSIMDLFRRKAVSTEYIKYREENVVTRDAKFVVACATSTHTTKKSWVIKTVELAKIRDIMDACIDMLDDYVWVEAELKQLIDESLKLKADYELLLGSGTGSTDMLSIETISSEFNPANALASFAGAFQDANIEQLADAMAGQISVFGQENAWMADTFIMNYSDFIKYRNLKDANGNKLVHTLSDNVATIAGMRVVTSPIVSANTCYVLDASQGEILDRQNITLKTSFENGTNIEHETVTFVGVERLQFHVPTIARDAFMKCSDMATAITAITAP